MDGKEQEYISKRSSWGLNAANFFQAEMVGVVLPVLSVFLKESRWRYDSIGIATAAAGLGTLLCQTPAGFLIDKFRQRRFMFAIMAVVTGLSFAAIPAISDSPLWVDSLLFVSGAAQSFFVPLLGALALALVGHKHLNRTMGTNQGWNHTGNIVSAGVAMALVSSFGVKSVFYAVGCSSLLAAASVLLIREQDLD
jgi:MFS family permease